MTNRNDTAGAERRASIEAHTCGKSCANGREQSAEHIAAVIASHVTSPYRHGDSGQLLARVPLRHLAEVRSLLAQPLARAA